MIMKNYLAFVAPLCLPFDGTPEGIQDLNNREAVVAGWGSTNTGKLSDTFILYTVTTEGLKIFKNS